VGALDRENGRRETGKGLRPGLARSGKGRSVVVRPLVELDDGELEAGTLRRLAHIRDVVARKHICEDQHPPRGGEHFAHDLEPLRHQRALRDVHAGGVALRAAQIADDALGNRVIAHRQEYDRRLCARLAQRTRWRLGADGEKEVAVHCDKLPGLLRVKLDRPFSRPVLEVPVSELAQSPYEVWRIDGPRKRDRPKHADPRGTRLRQHSRGRERTQCADLDEAPPARHDPSPAEIYSDLAADRYSYRARNAGAAESAVTVGVLAEVLLVIVLGVEELGRFADLGRDGSVAFRRQGLLE